MSLGEQFAEAFAGKDTDALREVLAPDVDFKGLTPRRLWEADGPDQVLEILLGQWVADRDTVTGLLSVNAGEDVEDTHHVGYRLAITTPDGPHVMEQQAYYRSEGDRIAYLRVMCSGFRPVT